MAADSLSTGLQTNGLSVFVDRFLSYGNLSAPIWFIGLEEGGGQDLAEIEQRVRAWEQRGANPVEDLAAYHRGIGVTQAECEQLFFNAPLVLAADPGHSGAEPRFFALGQTDAGRLLLEVFTLRGTLIRVISTRPMSRREREVYADAQAEEGTT